VTSGHPTRKRGARQERIRKIPKLKRISEAQALRNGRLILSLASGSLAILRRKKSGRVLFQDDKWAIVIKSRPSGALASGATQAAPAERSVSASDRNVLRSTRAASA